MTVPYHLRVGKYVDRSIFVELLSRLASVRRVHDYTYVGLGGPFLDDFRLLHNVFGFRKMVSIELDEKVLCRQRFNQPSKAIELRHESSSTFVNSFNFQDEPGVVLWLDYTKPAEYQAQLDDVETALRRMGEGDILRITFNIDRKTLKADGDRYDSATESEKADRRKQVLRSRLGRFYPHEEIPTEMFEEACDFSSVILQAFSRVASEARRGQRAKFRHLLALIYNDSSRMLTITGILAQDMKDVQAESLLSSFAFLARDAGRAEDIGTPALSVAERIFVEQRLPSEDLKAIEKDLAFLSSDELGNVARYYRHLPHFHRTSVLV